MGEVHEEDVEVALVVVLLLLVVGKVRSRSRGCAA